MTDRAVGFAVAFLGVWTCVGGQFVSNNLAVNRTGLYGRNDPYYERNYPTAGSYRQGSGGYYGAGYESSEGRDAGRPYVYNRSYTVQGGQPSRDPNRVGSYVDPRQTEAPPYEQSGGQYRQSGQSRQYEQSGQSGQYGQSGRAQSSGQSSQYGQTNQYGQTGQSSQYGQTGQSSQYGQTGQSSGQSSQYGQSGQSQSAGQSSQYGQSGRYDSSQGGQYRQSGQSGQSSQSENYDQYGQPRQTYGSSPYRSSRPYSSSYDIFDAPGSAYGPKNGSERCIPKCFAEKGNRVWLPLGR
jgi:hypothetical protein